MVWRRLFHRDHEPEDERQEAPDRPAEPTPHSAQSTTNPFAGEEQPARKFPLHMQQAPTQRQRPGSADPRTRLATLRQRRTAVMYDVEQGELAREDDNPWKQRASLLTEALDTVQADRDEAVKVKPQPYVPLDSTPIRDPRVTFENEIATVAFSIGDQRFDYEELQDWAERGHQVIRGDLARTHGSPEPFLPNNVPTDLRKPFQEHLDLSLFVYATDLRDRAVNGEPMPEVTTLADLAQPCPVCGGWTDVLGRCQSCARRNARIQELDRERNRLLSERAEELEEQHRVAERLPVARRRLADIDTEIATVERSLDQSGT